MCYNTLSMEQIGQNYGFILYRTTIRLSGSAVNISIPGLRDRGIVFVNQVCEMFDRLADFHVSDLGPNAALFVRLCLPSTLIRFSAFAWTENILKAEPFWRRAETTSISISFWTTTFTRRKFLSVVPKSGQDGAKNVPCRADFLVLVNRVSGSCRDVFQIQMTFTSFLWFPPYRPHCKLVPVP